MFGTVFQVRCCCAVLLFIVLIRVQNGKAIEATMHFAAGDLVLKRSLTRPTRGCFYVLRLSALLFHLPHIVRLCTKNANRAKPSDMWPFVESFTTW